MMPMAMLHAGQLGQGGLAGVPAGDQGEQRTHR